MTEIEFDTWADKMSDINEFRNWLQVMLKENIVTVVFTKKDGTERTMKCTLRPDLLPETQINEDRATRKENMNVLSVYDLENEGWRSFLVENVMDIKVVSRI